MTIVIKNLYFSEWIMIAALIVIDIFQLWIAEFQLLSQVIVIAQSHLRSNLLQLLIIYHVEPTRIMFF